jgi:DNA-binding response OmpR family regulator
MARGSILIVAKDASVREAFARSILARGWDDVEVRESAAEAVRELRSGTYGLAIVHAEVGDISGAQTVPVIQAADPHVRILFATPASSADLETQIRELGVFYYYIYDDPDTAELAAVVEDAIGAPRKALVKRSAILVVDDDVDFQNSVRIILESRGYRVLLACTIEDGLAVARAERPDLVLLDIVLKSATDGLQFSRELRRDPQIKHTPILVLSAIGGRKNMPYSRREDEELFPVDGFLDKPVAPEILLRGVETLLGGREPR